MPNALEALRNIIDEQDVEKLLLFIAENQNINYDNICPNGASALWWALMPAGDKNASRKIIDCLLYSRKSGGSHLVNPVQSFSGLTPSRYLQHIRRCSSYTRQYGAGQYDDEFSIIRILILAAEDSYERTQSGATEQNLAAIAADTQNAHDSTVGPLSRGNVIRLHRHYVEEQSNPLDENNVQMAGKDIEALINALQKEQGENAEQMLYGLRFCYSNTSQFEFQSSEENHESFSLSLAQLIALNWIAAKEEDAALLPDGATDKEALESRKKAILNILYDIATAYGKNSASCAGGACNRLGMALASQHTLVKAYPVGEKISNEVASLVFLRILGQKIDQLSKDNLEVYWAVIRCLTLPDDDAEEIKNYENFINANKENILAQMREENIDEKWAAEAIAVVESQAAYPVSNHKASYQLTHLMNIMHQHQFGLNLFNGNTSTDKAINEAVEVLAQKLLVNSASWRSLKSKFKVERDDLALEKTFILQWLELARRRQESDDLPSFIKEFKSSEFSEHCFALSFFLTEKEELKQQNPAQAKWLEHLSNEQIIDLVLTVNRASPLGVTNTVDLMQQLTLEALELGFTAHLSFEGMRFLNKDLRAFDFSGATLSNVTFENCLLPLTGSNINCHNVSMINCRLPFIDNDTSAAMFARLFYNLCGDENYIPSSLVTQFYLTESSEELLKHADSQGKTALMRAIQNGHIEIAEQIVTSSKCSSKLLKHADLEGYNALHIAASFGHAAILKKIFANTNCSSKLFEGTDDWGETTLTRAAARRFSNIVKDILASEKCSRRFLEKANRFRETVLITAVKLGDIDTVKVIISSDKCSRKLLEHADSEGRTALMWARRKGHTEIARLISPYISYQTIWESKMGEEDKILAIFDDYCKGTKPLLSQLSVFAHGHFNRHHTSKVRELIEKHERGTSLSPMLEELKQLKKDEAGSLARRLEFIESRHQIQETQQDNPVPAGPG